MDVGANLHLRFFRDGGGGVWANPESKGARRK